MVIVFPTMKAVVTSYIMTVFYDPSFSLVPLKVAMNPRNFSRSDIAKFAFTFFALQNTFGDSEVTQFDYFLWRALFFASIQVPPFRAVFTRITANCTMYNARFFRTVFGPPAMIYTVSAHFFANQKQKCDQFTEMLLAVSAALSVYAGMFCRPDCDWLRTKIIQLRPKNYNTAKKVHGICMALATLFNIVCLALNYF